MHRNLASRARIIGVVVDEELSVMLCIVSMLSKYYYKVSFLLSKCGGVHFTGIL